MKSLVLENYQFKNLELKRLAELALKIYVQEKIKEEKKKDEQERKRKLV